MFSPSCADHGLFGWSELDMAACLPEFDPPTERRCVSNCFFTHAYRKGVSEFSNTDLCYVRKRGYPYFHYLRRLRPVGRLALYAGVNKFRWRRVPRVYADRESKKSLKKKVLAAKKQDIVRVVPTA